MSYCPQCGAQTPVEGTACLSCGAALTAADLSSVAVQTLVLAPEARAAATAAEDDLDFRETVLRQPPPPPGPPVPPNAPGAQTIVGMAPVWAAGGPPPRAGSESSAIRSFQPAILAAGESPPRAGSESSAIRSFQPAILAAGGSPPRAGSESSAIRSFQPAITEGGRTLPGGSGAPVAPAVAPAPNERAQGSADGRGGTKIGVPLPSAGAPHRNGDAKGWARGDARMSGGMPHELGATMAPALARRIDFGKRKRAAPPAAVRPGKLRPLRLRNRKTWLAVGVAGALAVGAVLFVALWPGAPAITGRLRIGPDGAESLEVRCASCPDGTRLSVGGTQASVAGGLAALPTPPSLPIGQTGLKIAIDRPAAGRDETALARVDVPYRIRPDLSALQGDRPSIQLVVETAADASVSIDGSPVSLFDGRGAASIDVTDACTGLADDPVPLNRLVPYAFTLAGHAPERGDLAVSFEILPLHIDAPGPSVVIEGKSFVLAGRTAPGAEVLAAGRAIALRPDGSFAQVMNVSSVGSTRIEIRARMAGKAPRITRIEVQRVDRLETAASAFLAEGPISYAELAADVAGREGRPVVLGGEVVEARSSNYQTVLLLDVAPSFGCTARGCRVRLVQGAESTAKKGDELRAFGRVARPYVAPGGGLLPEVQVDFTLKGLR